MDKPSYKILFICRHNAVRSQVAEALTVKISHGAVEAVSAGPEPTQVPDYVNQWVSDLHGEPTQLQSTNMHEYDHDHFDMIVTLCDKTHTALPELPDDKEHIRWDFPHPDDAEALSHLEIELAERLRLMMLAKHLIA
ncbi:MAG: hypothetical protein ACPGPF_01100 [Pontibacterium sp.]